MENAMKHIEESEMKPTIELEYYFYLYAHKKDIKIMNESLKKVKEILQKNIRSLGWDFTLNVERARKENHPETEFLETLGKVIVGETNIKELNKYLFWNHI